LQKTGLVCHSGHITASQDFTAAPSNQKELEALVSVVWATLRVIGHT